MCGLSEGRFHGQARPKAKLRVWGLIAVAHAQAGICASARGLAAHALQVASMYLWLAQHFPPDAFPDKQMATEVAAGAAEQLAATLLKPVEHSPTEEAASSDGPGLELRGQGHRRKLAQTEEVGAALELC